MSVRFVQVKLLFTSKKCGHYNNLKPHVVKSHPGCYMCPHHVLLSKGLDPFQRCVSGLKIRHCWDRERHTYSSAQNTK